MTRKILKFIIIIVIVMTGVLACQNARQPASAESLYSMMTKQDVIEFYQFPPAFQSIQGQSTGVILANEKDTLQLVCSYPNSEDTKNRYPFYVLKDNHENCWTIIQEEPSKYKIYRLDQVKKKKWVKSFFSTGASVTLMVMYVIAVMILGTPPERQTLDKESIIRLLISAFIAGGILGLCL